MLHTSIYLYPPPPLYLTIALSLSLSIVLCCIHLSVATSSSCSISKYLSIYLLLYVVYIYPYLPFCSGSIKSIQICVIHLQRSSRWFWKSSRILKSVSVTGLSRPFKPYRPCMLALNSGHPTSSSRNCGIDPLEKQGKERRKEVGLEKT